jgi:hypothetical protein
MTYVNKITGERYTGGSITRNINEHTVFTGVPTEELLTEWGFEPYVPPVPERTLEIAKSEKTAEITAYDTSDAVNSFTLDGDTMWINRDDRISLMNSTTILKNAGQETTTLWYEGISYTLPCDTLIQMLSALEVYALQCYDVTEEHKAEVEALTTIEEVDTYEYKTDYPEKLSFEV